MVTKEQREILVNKEQLDYKVLLEKVVQLDQLDLKVLQVNKEQSVYKVQREKQVKLDHKVQADHKDL